MQIVSFGVSALYSGLWWLRWAKDGGEEGSWGQLGLFSGMVCVGTIAGFVAWLADIINLDYYYQATRDETTLDRTRQQSHSGFASANRFFSVFLIFYGIEFLCLIIAKLALLGRLATNATQSSQSDAAEMSGVRRR